MEQTINQSMARQAALAISLILESDKSKSLEGLLSQDITHDEATAIITMARVQAETMRTIDRNLSASVESHNITSSEHYGVPAGCTRLLEDGKKFPATEFNAEFSSDQVRAIVEGYEDSKSIESKYGYNYTSDLVNMIGQRLFVFITPEYDQSLNFCVELILLTNQVFTYRDVDSRDIGDSRHYNTLNVEQVEIHWSTLYTCDMPLRKHGTTLCDKSKLAAFQSLHKFVRENRTVVYRSLVGRTVLSNSVMNRSSDDLLIACLLDAWNSAVVSMAYKGIKDDCTYTRRVRPLFAQEHNDSIGGNCIQSGKFKVYKISRMSSISLESVQDW